MKPNIVFVDDEIDVLNAMKRNMRSRRSEWDLHFFDNAQAVIELMKSTPIDVLITDIRMPEIDGVALLKHTYEHHPNTVRIALTGQVEEQQFQAVIRLAHQCLAKPCPTQKIIDTIDKVAAFKGWPQAMACLAAIEGLPSPPETFQKLQSLMNDPDAEFSQIADVITEDPAITAKLLQIVNSAFFGLAKQVTNVQDAAVYLGTSTLFSLASSLCFFRAFDNEALKNELADLAAHSLKVATVAKQISLLEGASKAVIDQSFTAGILLTTGKLALLCNRTDQQLEALSLSRTEGLSVCEAESRVYGFDHLAVGAYLLDLWGLPDSLINAIRLPHTSPCEDSDTITSGCAAHCANHFLETGIHDLDSETLVDMLITYNFESHLDDWRACVEEYCSD